MAAGARGRDCAFSLKEQLLPASLWAPALGPWCVLTLFITTCCYLGTHSDGLSLLSQGLASAPCDTKSAVPGSCISFSWLWQFLVSKHKKDPPGCGDTWTHLQDMVFKGFESVNYIEPECWLILHTGLDGLKYFFFKVMCLSQPLSNFLSTQPILKVYMRTSSSWPS